MRVHVLVLTLVRKRVHKHQLKHAPAFPFSCLDASLRALMKLALAWSETAMLHKASSSPSALCTCLFTTQPESRANRASAASEPCMQVWQKR